jgi:phage major head subunit gpT-like protein
MLNAEGITGIRTGLNVLFQKGMSGFEAARMNQPGIPDWKLVAEIVKSMTDTEEYAWVRDVPTIREWIGPREVQMISASKYVLSNRNYEGTMGVDRNAFDDNKLYQYAKQAELLGRAAAEYVFKQIWGLLPGGLTLKGPDGVSFFNANHPLKVGVQSNLNSGGSTEYWYLLDRSKPILPFIHQVRKDPEFVAKVGKDEDNVFMDNQYLFGVDFRAAFGYTLWQLAYASNMTLDVTNFEAAFNAMADFKGWDGRKLGIRATDLVVPTKLRGKAMALIKERLAGGEDNPWYKGINVVECSYL